MISEHLFSPGTINDLNLAANSVSAAISSQSLRVSKDSLRVAQDSYALSLKLYKEFETTHDVEEERYAESKKLQENYLTTMHEILQELRKLNQSIEKNNI